MKKFLNFARLLTGGWFLLSAIGSIFLHHIYLIIFGVATGILFTLFTCIYFFTDSNDEYWREVEDIDQQKIFNDE